MRGAPVLLLLFAAACSPGPGRSSGLDALVLCGRDEVFIADVSRPEAPRKVWSWRAADRPELPEALRPKFRSTDECKPVEGGAAILITSSGGAAALVDRATGRALWWGAVVNAHSAELLPRDRIAVAGSYGENGNRVVLFDRAEPDRPLFHDEFLSAHGFAWDAGRERLWAIGERELRAYRLKDWETPAPSLERGETYPLPDAGGHDLRPVPGTPRLILTTNASVWLFDRDRKVFEIPDGFPETDRVKSVDVHPGTGRIAYVRAEVRHWAPRVRFLDPEGEIETPGEQLYKARWAVWP
jgi:hypothetical protein